MLNLPQLLLQFNRPFWLYHLAFTALSLYIIIGGGLAALILAIPLKLVGYAGAVSYQTYFAPQVYFYYRNTGTAVRKLYLISFALDILIFFVLVVIYVKFIA
ncbi:hypothetical protein [Mucilaginibacter terrae]|uniref:Uncharacterized protein n=1 Tax=Mucilaginibacter terrae TaxID=1955052 RepID=A0ABU3GPC6_9SPHI|nr:hypothetical protein [Mucilaginibacter terrae]MDT3401633.1 hypothetical protein [Mucilaginibacter terrae]